MTRRPVYNHQTGAVEGLAVYKLGLLGAYAEIGGPCLVDAGTFTVYLKPGHRGRSDRRSSLVVHVG